MLCDGVGSGVGSAGLDGSGLADFNQQQAKNVAEQTRQHGDRWHY